MIPSSQLIQLNGLQNLVEKRHFKAWFLDQVGVLHDGKQPYPGAISTLEKLATSGAKVVVITNSCRRASTTIEKLKSLGFDPSLFVGAITSGELMHQYLQRRDDPWFASLGRRCIYTTWNDPGAISFEGLDLEVVENIDEADFVLAHSTEALGLSSGGARSISLEDFDKILEKSAARGIPMVVTRDTLAAKYEKLGGEVKRIGKPGKIIFESAMAMVGADASDSIAVGDALHHDIKGANVCGMESVFITGGIHASELGLHSFGETAGSDCVSALASKYDAYPSYVLPSFTW